MDIIQSLFGGGGGRERERKRQILVNENMATEIIFLIIFEKFSSAVEY
jgi:hypothetical protein